MFHLKINKTQCVYNGSEYYSRENKYQAVKFTQWNCLSEITGNIIFLKFYFY
ncbi:hypothetical protein STBHUCCB_38490 [Salmonella enterica subsp. enterica serovar Typhi str. P-stx-12]|nr:hypothetical protein STBHUCCB_38490 [Salmonella enterica subsp. enterica serovar Typhi str. P-stx-12]AXR54629.1 hypothetical protein CJP42_0079 [Salmonella enterica subsp. enterica serovar Typhi]